MDKIDSLVDVFHRSDLGSISFRQQSEPQQVFTSIWNLDRGVSNGGFTSYFEYTDTPSIQFTPTALRSIGAPKTAEIVERAIQIVTEAELPAMAAERQQLVTSLGDDAVSELQERDDEYFEDTDDVLERLFDYVKARPEVFGAVAAD